MNWRMLLLKGKGVLRGLSEFQRENQSDLCKFRWHLSPVMMQNLTKMLWNRCLLVYALPSVVTVGQAPVSLMLSFSFQISSNVITSRNQTVLAKMAKVNRPNDTKSDKDKTKNSKAKVSSGSSSKVCLNLILMFHRRLCFRWVITTKYFRKGIVPQKIPLMKHLKLPRNQLSQRRWKRKLHLKAPLRWLVY